MIREREQHTAPGLLMLAILLTILAVAVAGLVRAIRIEDTAGAIAFAVVLAFDLLAFAGLFTVAPNEGRVLQLFGAYRGTAKEEGLRWANPFFTKKRISLACATSRAPT